MERCRSVEEYRLREFVKENFLGRLPWYYNGYLHTIAVKDDTGEIIVFKLINGEIIEIEV